MKNRDLLEKLSEKELLSLELRDLQFNLKSSWIQEAIDQVLNELKDRGLKFRPHFWVAEDWYSPDGVPGVAIPFYLLSPRLIRLEKRFNQRAEGETFKEALKILRHEIGHAIDNAFGLRRKKIRQQLFGLTSLPYPEKYEANQDSTDYVHHLGEHYAQAHPDEDWAETFAVWLTPNSNWRKKYQGTKALKKLEYVDKLMGELKGVSPSNSSKKKIDPLNQQKQTLEKYWQEKRAQRFSHHDSMKKDLHSVFKKERGTSLFRLIRQQKREISLEIAKKTKVQHYKITGLLNELELCAKSAKVEVEQRTAQKRLVKLLEKKTRVYIRKGFHKVSM